MKNDLILVVGSSGTVGSGIVTTLKSQGYKVRSTTSQKGVKVDSVYLNLATGEGLKDAFEGVDKAFFLSPPGYADQHALLSPLIQEAKRKGLKKVVLMTALGANAVETSPFRKAEVELEKSGLNYNIIRPNWFFQNFNTFWIQDIQEQSKIRLPAGMAKTSFMDARDISRVAAKLLVTEDLNNQAFDLTGPESLDHAQVAAAISQVVGKKIIYQEITPESLKQELLAAGYPEDYVDFMLLIFSFLKEGYNAAVNNHVKTITGVEPISLQQYVSDYKQTWM